jgi:hypothetical protein
MGGETLLSCCAELLGEYCVGWDTFFIDKLLDLLRYLLAFLVEGEKAQVANRIHTTSRVFNALSETKGLAIGGTRCEAVRLYLLRAAMMKVSSQAIGEKEREKIYLFSSENV